MTAPRVHKIQIRPHRIANLVPLHLERRIRGRGPLELVICVEQDESNVTTRSPHAL